MIDCNNCKYLSIDEYGQRILKVINKKDPSVQVPVHECGFYNERVYHYDGDDMKLKTCELSEMNNSFKEVE